jgi:hypothetical protein
MAAMLLTAALCACGGGTDPADPGSSTGAGAGDADYFPVVAGATWSYRASTWSDPGSWTTTVTVPGTAQVGGRQAWVFQEDNHARVGDSHQTFFLKDDHGVTFVGESPAGDFMMDAGAWDLLRFDGIFGSVTLLQLDQLRTPGMFGDRPWNLRILGSSDLETVTTPAGTFRTKRFDYTFIVTTQDDSGRSFETRHTLTEWRARGVGLVRQSYETGVQFFSTNWAKELVSYSIPATAR